MGVIAWIVLRRFDKHTRGEHLAGQVSGAFGP